MLQPSLHVPALGHAVAAIGALGLFVATGYACVSEVAANSPSTLAPIMATGPAAPPRHNSIAEEKCPAR